MDGIFSGWHIAILLVVVLLLFGAKRLPGAAQALGQSMHIFRKSVSGLGEEPPPASPVQASVITAPPAAPLAAPAGPAGPAADTTQQPLADLQRQLDDLQRRTGGENGGAVTDGPVPQAPMPQAPGSQAQHPQQ